MKIAWLAPFDIRLADGVQWARRPRVSHPAPWITHLAAELARRPEVSLHIVTSSPWIRRTHTATWNGVPVTIVKGGLPILAKAWPDRYCVDRILGYPVLRRRLLAAAMARRPDLLHLHGTENAYGLAGLGGPAPRLLSIQGINTIYGEHCPTLRFRVMARWERSVIRRTRYFGCRTHFDRGFVRQLNPCARIFDLPEAMNPCFFERQWQLVPHRSIAFLGGGNPLKGLDLLMRALVTLAASVRDIRLEIAGHVQPDDQRRYTRQADQASFQVTFRGHLNPLQIRDLFERSRVFVLPSRIDNSPNALGEAMSFGMPAVAFDVGGVASMMEDGVTGLLAPAGDTDALAGALRRVLEDDRLATDLGAAAARQARLRHLPVKVAELTRAAYETLLREEAAL